jgi:hypothetical protein
MTKIRRQYRNLIEKCLGIKIEEEGISYMELIILMGLVVILFSVIFPLLKNIENKTANLVEQTQRLQAALNNRSNVGVLRTISTGAGYIVDTTLVPTKLSNIVTAGTGGDFGTCAQFHDVETSGWTFTTTHTSGTCPGIASLNEGIVATAKSIASGSIKPAHAYVFSAYLTLDQVAAGTYLLSAAGVVQAADISPTATMSPGASATPSTSISASASVTPTASISVTPSTPASATSSPSASISVSASSTPSRTPSPSTSVSATASPSASEPPVSPTPSATTSRSATPSISISASASISISPSVTPSTSPAATTSPINCSAMNNSPVWYNFCCVSNMSGINYGTQCCSYCVTNGMPVGSCTCSPIPCIGCGIE